jgi:hypothetical protein
MNLEELAADLPHGFHDSEVQSISMNFAERIVEFILDVWVGSMADAPADRELYREARLQLLGVEYCAIDPPDPRYAYREPGPITIDLARSSDDVASRLGHSPGGFAGRFFVSDWNAFIRFAATDARLHWLAPASKREDAV